MSACTHGKHAAVSLPDSARAVRRPDPVCELQHRPEAAGALLKRVKGEPSALFIEAALQSN